ncbi:caffeoylshikimate esterase-like [Salvia miltiorrhiza]|uniref:caffeoylshikimate esterase-like n=1 Tax=Salvia miltiorrhiza TaxID=226208 RepID=UPI0025ABB432|nr:caffeoylshikimate esterase-like [Salvia miltiorrhiza]
MESGSTEFRYEEEFIYNSRGMKLFTCSWVPAHSEPKGLVFLCHGYGLECSVSLRGCGIRLAKAGYAVYGIDYQGHGKSSGLQCYIPNFDHLVNDCFHHFTSIYERQENKKIKKILMGESMGGAVALLLHIKAPSYWDMAVLVAPMCKFAEELKPHPVWISIGDMLSYVIPTWITPFGEVIDAAFRVPEIRDEVRRNPLCYKGGVRLGTATQLWKTSLELEARLEQVSLPFLLMHGAQDRVIHPSHTQLLHQRAPSTDKTFHLFPDMWHSLTIGELPQNIDIVFAHILSWLDARIS